MFNKKPGKVPGKPGAVKRTGMGRFRFGHDAKHRRARTPANHSVVWDYLCLTLIMVVVSLAVLWLVNYLEPPRYRDPLLDDIRVEL